MENRSRQNSVGIIDHPVILMNEMDMEVLENFHVTPVVQLVSLLIDRSDVY